MPILFIFNGDNMFEDGLYTVYSNSNINVGDEIELTTSKFDYDVVEERFNNNLEHCYIVVVEIVDEDLTNYEWERSRYGGAYGYATAKVLEVEEVI